MKKQFILILMLLFLFLSSFPIQSKALDCVELEGPEINQFTGAIVGTVLNVKNDVVLDEATGLKETKKYVLIDVDRSWNMEVHSQLIFEADSTWGYRFEEGKKYLIYLIENDRNYSNSPCSSVSIINSSNEYEEILGEGQRPIKKVNLEYKMWFMFDNTKYYIFAALFIGISVIFIWKWYSKRLKSKSAKE